jgi:hypothetical protein
MDTLITKALLCCTANNNRKASVSIGSEGGYIEGNREISQSVPERYQFSSVQFSAVLAVSYRRQKPVFRRVAVVS